jgi:hypothetical protein
MALPRALRERRTLAWDRVSRCANGLRELISHPSGLWFGAAQAEREATVVAATPTIALRA